MANAPQAFSRREALIASTATGVAAPTIARAKKAQAASASLPGTLFAGRASRSTLEPGLVLGTCCPCELTTGTWLDTEFTLDDDILVPSEGVCDATYNQVMLGLSRGFREFDTATHYENERSVGRAMLDFRREKNGGVSDIEPQVITKVGWIR